MMEEIIEKSEEEKGVLRTKLRVCESRLKTTTDQKTLNDLILDDLKINRALTNSENEKLRESVQELQNELEQFREINEGSSAMNKRKSLAPSVVSFWDMTNISVDAEDSFNGTLGQTIFGENLGDVDIMRIKDECEKFQAENLELKEEIQNLHAINTSLETRATNLEEEMKIVKEEKEKDIFEKESLKIEVENSSSRGN